MQVRAKQSSPVQDHSTPLETVTNTVMDGLIVIDEDGFIQSFNPAAERIFGYAPDEVIGRNVRHLMPQLYDSPKSQGYVGTFLETRNPRLIGHGHEMTAKRRDGQAFPVEICVNHMQAGGRSHLLAVVRDIAQRKEIETQQARLIEQLARSNAELERFAHICSHDLKEPMRGVAFLAQVLSEDHAQHLPDEARGKLARITQLCGRMQRRINDLLHFACIGTQDMPMETVDIFDIVTEVTDELFDVLDQKNARVEIIGDLPEISCNAALVQSVFSNLIANGIKYNDQSEKLVQVSCLSHAVYDGRVYHNIFCVADNGIGIDEKFHKDIFDIFKRLNPDKIYGEGTGAGLTFVQKIVERHGGTVWVKSNPGEGSRFYFTLQSREERA